MRCVFYIMMFCLALIICCLCMVPLYVFVVFRFGVCVFLYGVLMCCFSMVCLYRVSGLRV